MQLSYIAELLQIQKLTSMEHLIRNAQSLIAITTQQNQSSLAFQPTHSQLQQPLPYSALSVSMDEDYCYWDVRSYADFIVVMCNLGLSLLIFGFVLIAFRRSFITLKHGRWFIVYYLLMAWFIAYMVQYSYGAIIFQNIFRDNDQIDYESVVKYSVVFEFMDFIPAFLLMSCLYYTCFHLLTQVHEYCQKQGYQITKWELRFYTFLKKYQIVRMFFIGPSFTLLFFDQQKTDNIKICSTLELVLFLLDSVTCNLCLFFSLRTVRLKNALLQIDCEQERKKLRRQSITLQVAGIFRFVMAVIFIIVSGQIQSDENACPSPSLTRTIFYLIVGQILLHFVPVMIILSMFRISKKQIRYTMERTQSGLSMKLDAQ